jgi:hypothetical protein
MGSCDMRRYLEEIPQLRSIQHLEMGIAKSQDLGLFFLASMKGLKNLSIVNNRVATAGDLEDDLKERDLLHEMILGLDWTLVPYGMR